MKIINKQEFYKLPSGTLYSDYDPCVFHGLKIKGDTIAHDDTPRDFCYEDLIGNVKSGSSDELFDILDDAENHKTNFPLDFDSEERDGMYDEDSLYAIYDNDDVLGLIKRLKLLIKE